jgi:hypothetical protein
MFGWRADPYCNVSLFVEAELKNWTDKPLVWRDELPSKYGMNSVIG